jgi:small subunit ribosomal protein S8e
MVEWKRISRRKPSGGINNAVNAKTKTLADKGGSFAKTTIAKEDKRYKSRTIGGSEKQKVSFISAIQISQGNKTKSAKLVDVIENKANKHYVRQKVITKGAIVKAIVDDKEVNVKLTSRPGQSGQVMGVIVK